MYRYDFVYSMSLSNTIFGDEMYQNDLYSDLPIHLLVNIIIGTFHWPLIVIMDCWYEITRQKQGLADKVLGGTQETLTIEQILIIYFPFSSHKSN